MPLKQKKENYVIELISRVARTCLTTLENVLSPVFLPRLCSGEENKVSEKYRSELWTFQMTIDKENEQWTKLKDYGLTIVF